MATSVSYIRAFIGQLFWKLTCMIDFMYGKMGDGCEDGQSARKVRGPTTLKFLDNLRPGERFQVESWLNQPVGPSSSYMSTYISHLAKDGNNLPLTIQHWTQMPAASVLKAMVEVKKVFDCPDDLNGWIRAKLQDRWKYHKHAVKKEGFYKYTTQEERLANRPKDVVESQWGPLVEYWQNPKQEALSAMMREIKSKQTVHQSTGSKSHVKYAAELEAKLKRPPTAQEIYNATHAKRKKQMVAFEQKPSQQTSENSSSRQNDAILQCADPDFMTPISSPKEMKMSAKLSGSRERNTVSTDKHEYRLRSRSNSIPTSLIPVIQESVTEDSADSMQAESDESLEGFGSDSTPITKLSRMADGNQRSRKIRGLKFLDTLRSGQRLKVESWLNSPVGPNSTSLATYISHLAKDGDRFPLTISHWTQMPAVFVLNAILEIKKVFDYPDDLDDWLRAKLNDRWKYHKHAVKKEGFYKYTTQEERLANRPKDVVESQWGPLVEYWQNPKQEERSAMMREIKSRQTVHQSTGSKSHVKYAAELEAKLKRPPTAQEIYDATHAKRKKQKVAFEQKPSQQVSEDSSTRKNDAIVQHAGQDFMTPVSSSKEMKMSAKLSGSRERNTVFTNKHEYRLRSRSNSTPTSLIPVIQESVTEDSEDNMQAESDESLEGYGSDSTPIKKLSRMADGNQRANKIRGLKFLDTLQPGQRLQVQSWLNSPVGPNSTSLATYISHLAKDGNRFPLTVSHWTQMPAVSVLNAILEVKKVFDYPDDLDDWIRAKLNDRWRNHKHFVKKDGFYKYKTQEERLAHRPEDVVESQWGPLVEYWQNPHQEEKCAKAKASKSKQTVQQSSGCKAHVKYAKELEAKLKRPPTAQEIYDATHAKRKSPVSSKKMKMSAEASGSWEINTVSAKNPVHLPLSRCNSISTSPVPLIQAYVTEDDEDNMQVKSDESEDSEDNMQAESDEFEDNEDNMQAESDEFEDNEDNMQAESDESREGFGSVGEPVDAARTTSSAEPVEAAKTTSYATTVVSNLVSISTPKDISSPLVGSTSVSGRGSDEEFEFIDNFKIPKEYAVLYKKIFDKYGHMATKKVIKSNDTVLVACVTSLLKIISTMETARGSDLSDALLESWDGDIEDVENLGFNIKWLRDKFDEVKNNWKSSSGLRKKVEINQKKLDTKQVKHASLLARKEELQRETSKVITEIKRSEAEISTEKKAIQEKLGPECNFLNEPILGKLLS
ncbi:uncharacterized protein LOC113322435 [Papaver somniferum]|uniref:uncharacterized protein LOC113322435 n=1 Tax=Papaver somniferum TaxID=3469 RepID=UPI000E702CCD|nr:uncharacterized protein LOC113322435 [Papaver somniferum]